MKDIISIWKSARSTIIEARNYIVFVIILFIAGIIYGNINLQDNEQFLEIFQNLLKTHRADSYFPFIIKIFIRNSIVAYVSIRFGILLGIFPVISSFFNGLMVGWLSTMLEKISGLQLFFMILPHGIFELSAMFIAWGVGLHRVRLLFSNDFKEEARVSLKKAHRVYLSVVLPVLFVAALVEGRVML